MFDNGRPPRRGTWIEIGDCQQWNELNQVVPRVGSTWIEIDHPIRQRSRCVVVPRVGGRGLKFLSFHGNSSTYMSSPA